MPPQIPMTSPLSSLPGNLFGNSQVSNLLKSLGQYQDQANQANIGQYNNLLSTVRGAGKDIFGPNGYLTQLGAQGTNRINENATKALGAGTQNLINRGLYNSSAAGSLARGNAMDKERQLQELNSGIAGQKVGALQQQEQLMGNALLSRQNQGPDLSQYMALIQMLMGNKPQTMFSNAGSINSLNKPGPGGGGGQNFAPGAGQPLYYGTQGATNPTQMPDLTNNNTPGAGSSMSISPFTSWLTRPGDTFFGND